MLAAGFKVTTASDKSCKDEEARGAPLGPPNGGSLSPVPDRSDDEKSSHNGSAKADN